MIKISDEFKKYTYTFNRSLSSDIVLPYDKNSTLLGVNELVNGYNFNSSLDKLQSNLMYLYSVSKLADPDIPTNYEGYIGTTVASGDKLEIQIKGFTPYDVAVASYNEGNSDFTEMPYLTVTDKDNKRYGVFFGYHGYNTQTKSLSTSCLSSVFIDCDTAAYGGNANAANAVQNFLSAFDFQVQSFIFASGYPELYSTDQNPVIALSGNSDYGGVFFNNAKFSNIASYFGTAAQAMKYQQGTENLVFKLHKNAYTTDSEMTIIDIPADIKSSGVVDEYAYNNLVSTAAAPGNLSAFNVIFCCSPSSIVSLSAKSNASSLSSDYTFTNYISSIGINNDLPYESINGSAYHDNSLYVSDTATNNVVKINVRGFTQNDTIRDNTFYETEIIGGLGGVRDNYSFNEPQVLQFYKDNLYVYDKGNLCIKVYDKDLGYVRNLRKSGFAKTNPPTSIKIYNDTFYWLTSGGKFFTLDNDLNLLKEEILYNTCDTEYFTDFIVAENINMLYFLTKENIYKYYFDNAQYIGRFNLSENKIDKTELSFLSHVDNTLNSTNLYAYGKRGRSGYLLRFNENDQYLNLLSDYDFEIYGKDEIEVDKNEFTANFAYNKSILKLLSNNLQFKNFITNMVSVSLRRDGGIDYTGVVYFNPAELEILNFNPGLDNYIGTNEIFSRSVVNRVLEKIYDYQTRLLSLFKNQVSPPPVQLNTLTPALNALMLEDFPGNWDGTFNTEQGLDFIELETDCVPQDHQQEMHECSIEDEITVVYECCPFSPNSSHYLFQCDMVCTPPCDLIKTTFWVDEITTYVLDENQTFGKIDERKTQVHSMNFFHLDGLNVEHTYGANTWFSKPIVPPDSTVTTLTKSITVERTKVELASAMQYFNGEYFSTEEDPVTYAGNRTYKTRNVNNDLVDDITFCMYTVPDTVKNIGTFDAEGNLSNQCWGYVGFDKTSYDWNLANLTGCYFIPEQFLVYFTKPDPKQNCGTVQTFKGEGGLWPGISEEIVLGSTTGVVDFWFQSYNVADRFQVWFDGECVIDTGFVGSWTQRTDLKDYLEERLKAGPTNFRPQKGSNDLTYKLTDDTDLDNIIDQYKTQNPNDETDDKNYDDGKWIAGDLGYPGYGRASFIKETATVTAIVKVWAPAPETATIWKYTLWCPNPDPDAVGQSCGAYARAPKPYGQDKDIACSECTPPACTGFVADNMTEEQLAAAAVKSMKIYDYKGCRLYDIIDGNVVQNVTMKGQQSPCTVPRSISTQDAPRLIPGSAIDFDFSLKGVQTQAAGFFLLPSGEVSSLAGQGTKSTIEVKPFEP